MAIGCPGSVRLLAVCVDEDGPLPTEKPHEKGFSQDNSPVENPSPAHFGLILTDFEKLRLEGKTGRTPLWRDPKTPTYGTVGCSSVLTSRVGFRKTPV
jgi:hypothetical protein